MTARKSVSFCTELRYPQERFVRDRLGESQRAIIHCFIVFLNMHSDEHKTQMNGANYQGVFDPVPYSSIVKSIDHSLPI